MRDRGISHLSYQRSVATIARLLTGVFDKVIFLSAKMKGSDTECLILVLLEMGLSFAGIVSNLLIVTAVKEDDTVLQGSTLNYLLFNLCFSNLIISFLVSIMIIAMKNLPATAEVAQLVKRPELLSLKEVQWR